MRIVRDRPANHEFTRVASSCADSERASSLPHVSTTLSTMPIATSDSRLRAKACALRLAAMAASPDRLPEACVARWLATAMIARATAPTTVSQNRAGCTK